VDQDIKNAQREDREVGESTIEISDNLSLVTKFAPSLVNNQMCRAFRTTGAFTRKSMIMLVQSFYLIDFRTRSSLSLYRYMSESPSIAYTVQAKSDLSG